MKNYYVEGPQWFVVTTKSKARAKTLGIEQFGRGRVSIVREATKEEVRRYIAERGADAMRD